jgi:MFS family permease
MAGRSFKGAYPWYVAGLMGCSYAVSFVDRGLLSVAGAPIKQALHLSDSAFGLLHGAAFVLLFCVAGIPIGWLADRWNRRAIIAVGMLFWTAMTAACGMASSFSIFFIARIGVGLGEATLVPAGASLLAAILPGTRMTRAAAIFLMGATIGNAIALLGGGYLLGCLTRARPLHLPLLGALAPWQALFLLACLPGFVVAPWIMTLREPDRVTQGRSLRRDLAGAIGHLRANARAYGCLAGATACSNVLTQTQGAWMPLFYVRHFGLQPADGAMLVGALYILSAPAGQFAGGYLTDRLQTRGIAGAQNLTLAIGMLLSLAPAVLFCTTSDLLVSEASYAVFNFLVFAVTPNGLAGLQIMTPTRYRGIMTALLVSAVSVVGIGFGPATVGLLTDHLFHDELALGWALLSVFAVAGLCGPVLALAGRRDFARTVRGFGPAGAEIPA